MGIPLAICDLGVCKVEKTLGGHPLLLESILRNKTLGGRPLRCVILGSDLLKRLRGTPLAI